MTALPFQAGAASTRITPDEPLWLAGYAARTAPAKGTISELSASALALEDTEGHRFVIVSADLIAITPVIAEPVAAAVLAKHGLPRSQLLLAATHTHYGPEFRPDKSVFFHIPREFSERLPAVAASIVAAIVQSIDEALARLEPVRLSVRQTSATFAHNRRRRGIREGKASTEDVVDHDVPVLECVDACGQRKAVVFGYACHNTTIPPDDCRYSSDWAGFAKQQLERASPGAVAIFLPGAGADQDPEPSGSVELSQQHGRELATVVERALRTPGIEVRGPIRVAWEEVELPLEPVTSDSIDAMLRCDDLPRRIKAQFLLEQLQRGEPLITSYAAPCQVVRFGDVLLLIALSGEPVVDWARKWKREARSEEQVANRADSPLDSLRPRLLWVAGYCNDMFGYVPTRRVQEEGGYEGGRATLWSWLPAPFTIDLEDHVSGCIQRLIALVYTE